MRNAVLSLILCALPHGCISSPLSFSVGFTSDMVLQRGADRAASIYGIASSDVTSVIITVTDDAGKDQPYNVTAALLKPSTAGGTADPLCMQRCVEAGHCCNGNVAACQKPSCAMGCILAGRSSSISECKSHCSAAAKAGCSYTVVSPAGPFHLPGDTTQNETLDMCQNGPILTNGTQCTSCGAQDECSEGCGFGFVVTQTPPPFHVWRAQLHPHEQPGGSFTVTATAYSSRGNQRVDDSLGVVALKRVTWGDVFFCSGQSNMDLALEYSFSKPQLDKDVAAGRYDNIRLFQYGGMGTKYEELEPAYVTTAGTINDPAPGGGYWANLSTASAAIPSRSADATYNLYSQFSATCFYFASSLTEARGSANSPAVPIGLIQSAVGGSQIEAWPPVQSLAECRNESLNANGQSPPARLFNGMVAPFVNTTVAGFLWYQGENNCGGTMGNSVKKVGYGCQLPSMVSAWRSQWSANEGTTDPLAPFGVVTLAAGGSEGHDENMAGMRWSQTANFGVLPNVAMPNSFLAHAYDLGDPMDNLKAPCVNASGDRHTNASAFGPAGPCIWPPATAWNAAVRPLRSTVFPNIAPSFMGGIHPRFKHEVGRRLAASYLGAISPTLAGCNTADSSNTRVIELRFNQSLLNGESLLLQWAPNDARWNMSTWQTTDSSTLMVCTGQSNDCLADSTLWLPAPLFAGSSEGSLFVNLSGIEDNVTVSAVRYGWSLGRGGDTCCPSKEVAALGIEPCIPGSCPIISSKTSLPANPFFATLDAAGKCHCMTPQECEH